MLTKEPQQTWVFDRYVNGVLMAEGVEVTRASSLEEAMIIAARLAACGPNGETPVLILCDALDALARAEKAEQERDRIDQWRETAMVERDTYSEERDAAEAQVGVLRAERDGLRAAVEGLLAVLDRNEKKGPIPDVEMMFCWLAAQEVRAAFRKIAPKGGAK